MTEKQIRIIDVQPRQKTDAEIVEHIKNMDLDNGRKVKDHYDVYLSDISVGCCGEELKASLEKTMFEIQQKKAKKQVELLCSLYKDPLHFITKKPSKKDKETLKAFLPKNSKA